MLPPKPQLLASQQDVHAVQAMIPCSEAQAEALPVTIPFSVLLDAPMDVLWKTLGDWTNISWVFGAKVSSSLCRARTGGQSCCAAGQ